MRHVLIAGACLLLAACAAPLNMQPAKFVPAATSATSAPTIIQLTASAVVQPSGGRPRQLDGGSTWQAVGRIEQGDVYKRLDGIFIIQARDVHEARLVISGGKVVGFYLPVEGQFSPAVPPVQLTLRGNS
jgi:hypothetical protein